MKNRRFENCFEANYFLYDHPIFQGSDKIEHFDDCFEWEVHMVSPKSGRICRDERGNTEQVFWLAASPWKNPAELSEEIREICPHGTTYTSEQIHAKGATFEQAMIKLAEKVQRKFGNYKDYSEIE